MVVVQKGMSLVYIYIYMLPPPPKKKNVFRQIYCLYVRVVLDGHADVQQMKPLAALAQTAHFTMYIYIYIFFTLYKVREISVNL